MLREGIVAEILELAPVVEPVPVQDIYTDGITSIELLGGGCARFTLYADRRKRGKCVRVIVARFVIQMDALPRCIAQATAAVAQHARRKLFSDALN
jgi:hypothetical protein